MRAVAMLTLVKNMVREIRSALWFRPAIFCLVAIAIAVAIAFFDTSIERGAVPWLPEIDLSTVRDLLKLLAGSMLTVATVTLSVLMLVLSLVAGQASPRAVPELMADPVTQNALGTFLATFVFSLASLMLFGLGATTGAGITLTLIAGLVYVATAVRYFVQWIGHVANSLKLNRMIDQIHAQARSVLDTYLSMERAENGIAERPTSSDGRALSPDRTGYVQFVDLEAMDSVAEDKDLWIDLHVREGSFVHPGQQMMTVHGLSDEGGAPEDRLRRAVAIGFERSHKGDPLLGFELLAEVACRALSPGVNDPQTAITSVQYVSGLLCQAGAVAPQVYPPGTSHKGRVQIEWPGFDSMIKRSLPPIVRDGAGFFEVLTTVLKGLDDLAATCDPAYLDHLAEICRRVREFSRNSLPFERDGDAIEAQVRQVEAVIGGRRSATTS